VLILRCCTESVVLEEQILLSYCIWVYWTAILFRSSGSGICESTPQCYTTLLYSAPSDGMRTVVSHNVVEPLKQYGGPVYPDTIR